MREIKGVIDCTVPTSFGTFGILEIERFSFGIEHSSRNVMQISRLTQ